ncbi:MAG TPA: thioesterase family protein, partial [Reyranella sp.]|nr:thioesterase family protein [Reyranella sp.]
VRLLANGTEVVRATVLRIRKAPEVLPVERPFPPLDLPPPEGGSDAMAGAMSDTPFLSGLSARNVKGSFGTPGPAAIWFRAARPIIEGAELSPLMRAAIAADFCNGTSSILDFRQWTFINGDLTLSLAREPVGDWVLLDAETWAGPDSVGLASARLADRDGYFGRAAQSLLFEKRS